MIKQYLLLRSPVSPKYCQQKAHMRLYTHVSGWVLGIWGPDLVYQIYIHDYSVLRSYRQKASIPLNVSTSPQGYYSDRIIMLTNHWMSNPKTTQMQQRITYNHLQQSWNPQCHIIFTGPISQPWQKAEGCIGRHRGWTLRCYLGGWLFKVSIRMLIIYQAQESWCSRQKRQTKMIYLTDESMSTSHLGNWCSRPKEAVNASNTSWLPSPPERLLAQLSFLSIFYLEQQTLEGLYFHSLSLH